jgi:hypothetical protein
VHATLALAATQVDAAAVMRPADRHEWQKAIDPEYAARRAEDIAWLHGGTPPAGKG